MTETISAKTYAVLAVITAIKRPWGYKAKMIDVTADSLNIYHPMDNMRPPQRTRSRTLQTLVDDGLLRREGRRGGTTYYPTEKLVRYLCSDPTLAAVREYMDG